MHKQHAHAVLSESRWSATLRHIVEGLHLMGNPHTLGLTAVISLLYFGLQVLSVFALMRAYGLDLSFWVAGGVLTLVRLSTVVPNAPGNLGLINLACVMALGLFEVEKTDAKTFSIILFVALTLPLLIGGAARHRAHRREYRRACATARGAARARLLSDPRARQFPSYNLLMLTPTEKIWHNGRFIPWEDATIHVLSHVVSYGSCVFEGIRCYSTPSGPAVFRLREHIRRMLDSAKIYRMDNLGFSAEELADAMLELVRVNKMDACYLRPIVLRGYGEIGVNGMKNPIDVYIACWEWGKYLGEEALAEGVDVCVSSWNRMAPNTLPALAKAGANYMNSQLIKMEAIANGYAEGIALDANGYVSEGSGENIFVVRDGKIHTPPLGAVVLPGITRDAILTLARDLGIPVVETHHPARDAVHRRRSLLHRHRRRDHADPLDRPDHDRQRPPRPDRRAAAEGILRRDQRHARGYSWLALAGPRTGRVAPSRSRPLTTRGAGAASCRRLRRPSPRRRCGPLRESRCCSCPDAGASSCCHAWCPRRRH